MTVVVITGASAGVGRATARAYGARGAHVGLIARGRDGLDAARREIEKLGGRAVVARSSSWQLWASMHRWPLALLAGGALLAAGSLGGRARA
jgi:NAD(P)-dependent dehydrogenase (short-subunit alcohol dehydrogenase family)